MNKRGQALVEFIMIIPIFIMIIFTIIDFGIILYNNNIMEGKINDVVDMYRNDKTYNEIKEYINKDKQDINLVITNENNTDIEIVLEKEIELITPGLGLIIGDPFKSTAKRVISYES